MSTSQPQQAGRDALAGAIANQRLRSSTRHLLEAICSDTAPRDSAKVDFGIDTPQHFEALSHAVLGGRITPEMLDATLGNGNALTQLVKLDTDNPHRGIVFESGWHQLLRERIPAERQAAAGQARAKDRDIEMEM
jgi:hypothetical protein